MADPPTEDQENIPSNYDNIQHKYRQHNPLAKYSIVSDLTQPAAAPVEAYQELDMDILAEIQ